MEGLILAARYSLGPSQSKLSMCASLKRVGVLRQFLSNPENNPEIAEQALRELPFAYSYLETIAREVGGMNPFDRVVVEAFFIGNELTGTVSLGAIKEMLVRLGQADSMQAAVSREKLKALPPDFKPHHNYNLFWFKGESITNEKLYLLELCRVSQGEVVDIREGGLVVKKRPLVVSGVNLALAESAVKERIAYDKNICPPVVVGDIVSFHWGMFCQILNSQQSHYLADYTHQALQLSRGK